MAAIKFSKQYIEPNPNEIDYWVDLSSNQYGGRMKYYNGFEWVDLVNPDGTHIDINDFYNKLQINQMLSQKASVDSVESKVDDDEVSDVIKNISFSQRGEDGVEMVMFKYDDTTVGIQLPIADNTKSGIITKDTFKNLVNQTQLQQLYSEMYTKLSEIRNNYQPKLRAGANIKIENNVISAVSKIGTDWNDIANKPDIYDKSQVDTMMSGVYKIKGSRRFEALPLYTNTVGDTYNITNDFSLHGEDYPLGTNVVWTENGWDALAGIFDTSELEEDIQEVKDNYLPLSGGKMTGKLVIYKAVLDIVHDVNLYISFKKSDGTYFGDIGFSNGLPSIWMPGKDWCKIWHEGNFNPDDYLSLKGGTITGLLQINRNPSAILFKVDDMSLGYLGVSGNDPVFWNAAGNTSYKIYHESNSDDLFKAFDWGNSGDSANDSKFGTIVYGGNLSDGPETTGQLITFGKGNYKVQLFHNNGTGLYCRNKWGSNWKNWKTIAFTDSDITGNAATATILKTPNKNIKLKLIDETFLPYGNTGTAYLSPYKDHKVSDTSNTYGAYGNLIRLEYNATIGTDIWFDANTGYLPAYRTYAPEGGSDWNYLATIDSNVASATKLATPVKLWGNDFDGSGDINGRMRMLSNDGLHDSWFDIIDGYLCISASKINANYTGINLCPYGGNVGIGTSSPSSKLDVKSDLDTVAKFMSTSNTNKAVTRYIGLDNEYWTIGKGAGSSASVFGFYSGLYEDNVLTLKDNGNVGIGINTPAYKLDVNGAISCKDHLLLGSKIAITDDIGKNYLLFGSYSYDNYVRGRSIYFQFGEDGQVASLSSKGNVGIGTTNPEYKLHVYGTVRSNSLRSDYIMSDNTEIKNKITSGDLVDWYGVSWSENSSDPTCTRIGNMALHRSLPILSAMKGYVITNKSNGNNFEQIIPLDDNWISKYGVADNEFITGAIRNMYTETMIKIPEFWYIDDYEPSNKTHNLKISQTAKAGWCHHKEAYVGAYEGYHDGTYYRSTKNVVPTVSVTREQLRTAARTNGFEDEYKWNIYTYEEHRAICHLFLVEYATRNSQAPVNTALTADGFKQGGLGSGCTTGTMDGEYVFIPTGTTDSLGNGSGQVAYTASNGTTYYANRYRGIENPFGHIWKHVDDVVNTYNTETTYKMVYKCDKPEYFATNKNAKYKPLCSFPGGSKMQGWSKEIKATINCDFFKYSVGGSESTYLCDYNYDNDDTSEHCLLIGGRSGYGGGAGLFCFGLNNSVGGSSVHIGSRLTYLPWAE